jgi:hypothetical protein
MSERTKPLAERVLPVLQGASAHVMSFAYGADGLDPYDKEGWVITWDGSETQNDRDAVAAVVANFECVVPRPVTEDDIQSHIDATARSRGYRDGFALAGYVSSTITTWAAEAAAFIAWRDSVWVYVYQEFAKVQNGEREHPGIAAMTEELPVITWPS